MTDPIPSVAPPLDVRDGINHLAVFFRRSKIARAMGHTQHWLSVHLAFGQEVARSHPFRERDAFELGDACRRLAGVVGKMHMVYTTDKRTASRVMSMICEYFNPRFFYADVLGIDQRLWHKYFSIAYTSPSYYMTAEQCDRINNTLERLATHLNSLTFVCNDDELKKKTL